MRKILRPDDVQAKTDDGELDRQHEQENGHAITDLPVSKIPGPPPNVSRGTNTLQREVHTTPEEDLQRQTEEEEEEPIQTERLQRQADDEEEEPVQAKINSGDVLQRMCPGCEEEMAQRQPEEEEEDVLQTKLIQRKMTDMRGLPLSRFGYVGEGAKSQQVGIRVMLRSAGVQAKLTIGQPNDKYEQEADRVADQVMAMPDSEIQRQPENEEEEEHLQAKSLADQITPLVQRQEEPEEEEEAEPENEEEEELQTKSKVAKTPVISPGIESGIQSLKSGGHALETATRNFFEPRFDHDFSNVRVHTNSTAADTAKTINARAFTLGNNVVLGSGEYAPRTTEGQRLMAHELAHVIQQGSSGRLGASRRYHWNEQYSDAASEQWASLTPITVLGTSRWHTSVGGYPRQAIIQRKIFVEKEEPFNEEDLTILPVEERWSRYRRQERSKAEQGFVRYINGLLQEGIDRSKSFERAYTALHLDEKGRVLKIKPGAIDTARMKFEDSKNLITVDMLMIKYLDAVGKNRDIHISTLYHELEHAHQYWFHPEAWAEAKKVWYERIEEAGGLANLNDSERRELNPEEARADERTKIVQEELQGNKNPKEIISTIGPAVEAERKEVEELKKRLEEERKELEEGR